MTREQVIEWAKQAKIVHKWTDGHKIYGSLLNVVTPSSEVLDALTELCRLAREDMREQAAKVCDFRVVKHGLLSDYQLGRSEAAEACAQAIRNLEV